MVDVAVNDGTNKSRGSNDKNKDSKVFSPGFKDCIKCNHLINVRLQEKVENFEKMPTSESKMIAMKAFRMETDLRLSAFFQDQRGIMDKMIAYEKELLEKENEVKEKERIITEANIRANKVKDSTIQAGAPKLEIDCTEAELTAIFKKFILESKNKKNALIYGGTNKVLAIWIRNSIKLKSGHEITYNTIVNGLSRIDN